MGDVTTIALGLLTGSLISCAAVGLIVFVIVGSLWRPGSGDAYFAATASGVVNAFYVVVVDSVAGSFTVIFGLFSRLFSNYKVVIAIVLVAVAFSLAAPHAQTVIRVFDKYTTEIVVPVYQQLIVPIGDVLRLLATPALPFYNLIRTFFWVSVHVALTVLVECLDQVNAKQVVLNIFALILAIVQVFTGLLANLESDAEIRPVYAAFANVTDPFTPWVNCYCREISFVWNTLVFYVHRDNFQFSGGPLGILVVLFPSHDLINAILNLVRQVLRFAANFVINLINNPTTFYEFGCGTPDYICNGTYNGTCNPYINCQIHRPPYFSVAFQYVCDFAHHWMGCFDDIILCVIRIFFSDKSEDQIPRPFAVLAGVICFVARFLEGIIDILFKLDLLVNPNVRYMKYVDITLQFDALRESPAAFIVALDAFRVAEMHYMGCAIGNLVLLLINLIEFVLKFFVTILTFDADFISAFLGSYDYATLLETPGLDTIICFEAAVTILNVDWGIAVRYTFIVILEIIMIIIVTFQKFNLLFSSTPELYLDYYVEVVTPRVFVLFDVMLRWCIALGNCMRTFDSMLAPLGLSEGCLQQFNATYPPAYNYMTRTQSTFYFANFTSGAPQVAMIQGIESHSNLFCVLGDATQGGTQLLISLIQLCIQTGVSIIGIIDSPDLAQAVSLLRIALDTLEYLIFYSILNIIESINGFLSSIGSFFGCKDNDYRPSNPSIGTNVKYVLGNFTNIIQFPMRLLLLSGEVFGLIVECIVEPDAVPIFLRDPTGCPESGTSCSMNPGIRTCTTIYAEISAIVCRYIFVFWDYVFTWFPKTVVALVEFILCLALDNNDDQGFVDFYNALATLRCLICNVVQIVVSIFKAVVNLFQGNILYFIYAILCLPPFSVLFVIFQVIVAFLNNWKCLIFSTCGQASFSQGQRLTFSNLVADAASIVDFVYCGSTATNTYSPHYPDCIVVTFIKSFFGLGDGKRRRSLTSPNEPRSIHSDEHYTTISLDGQEILLSPAYTWVADDTYNYTSPLSPCHASYQLLEVSAGAAFGTFEYWSHEREKLFFLSCVFSTTIANATNTLLPLMTLHPLEADILVNPIKLFNFTITLVVYVYNAFNYIAERNKGSLLGQSWQAFKSAEGLTNDFPLLLISLFDESLHTASVALTLVSNADSWVPTSEEIRAKRNVDTDWADALTWYEYALPENQQRISNARHARGIPTIPEEVFHRHVELGPIFGKMARHSGSLVKTVGKMQSSLLSIASSPTAGVTTKRSSITGQNYTFDELKVLQRSHNAHVFKQHVMVIMNFTRDSFYKIGDIFWRSFTNVLDVQPHNTTSDQYKLRKTIRNTIMTAKSHLNHVFGNTQHDVTDVGYIYSRLKEEKENTIYKRSSAYDVITDPVTLYHSKRGTFEASDREMIPVGENIYTRYEEEGYQDDGSPNTEMVLYQKMSSDDGMTSHFSAIEYPDGGFVFGFTVFPLAALCFPTLETSSKLPPPFGDRTLPGFCVDCKLALEWINQVTYYTSLAINDTIQKALAIDPAIPENPHLRNAMYFPTLIPTGPTPAPDLAIFVTGDSINQTIARILWYPLGKWIFHCSYDTAANALIKFFTSADSDSTDSFAFWIEYFIGCDHATQLRCSHGKFPGLGLPLGILWTYGTLFVVTLILTCCGIPSVVLIFLWTWSFPIMLSVAYYYSPICLPAIPDCLPNDIYYYMWINNGNCLNWVPIFGTAVSAMCSLDTNQCYDIATQVYTATDLSSCASGQVFLGPNERYFPNCQEGQYGFSNPVRIIFYAVYLVWPAFTDFLQKTESPTFKAIRYISNFEESLNFTEIQNSSGDITACFAISSGSALGNIILYAAVGVVAVLILYVLIQVIFALITGLMGSVILLVAPVTEIAIASSSSGGGMAFPSAPQRTASGSKRRNPTSNVVSATGRVLQLFNVK